MWFMEGYGGGIHGDGLYCCTGCVVGIRKLAKREAKLKGLKWKRLYTEKDITKYGEAKVWDESWRRTRRLLGFAVDGPDDVDDDDDTVAGATDTSAAAKAPCDKDPAKAPIAASASADASAVESPSPQPQPQPPSAKSATTSVRSPSQPQKRKRTDPLEESRYYPKPIRPCPAPVTHSFLPDDAGQNQQLIAIRHDQHQLRLVVNAVAAEVNSMWYTLQGCQYALQQVVLELQKMQQ
jgi:hypothetical protein